jgi:hypothetical protein
MNTVAYQKAILAIGLAHTVLFASLTAHATMVTPIDAVKRNVVVHAAASGRSAAVGKLDPGDQAEQLESVSHWFKVELSDGTVGYVSKRWTEVTWAVSSSERNTCGERSSSDSSGGCCEWVTARGLHIV